MFKFTHTREIPRAARGTLAKCDEELAELKDADSQHNRWHTVIEAADLINSTYTFVWRQYRVPFFVVIAIALLSGIYKPIVRWLRRKE
jgi:hypothetical protein